LRVLAFALLAVLALSVFYAVLALSSPVMSLPSGYRFASFVQEAGIQPAFWAYQSYAEISEGFAVVAFFLLLVLRVKTHEPSSHAPGRKAFLALSIVGISAFLFISLIDILQEPKGPSPIERWAVAVSTGPIHTYVFGWSGFACLLLATIGLTLYRSRLGVRRALMDSVTYMAAPSVLLLELGLLEVSPPIMASSMTLFLQPLRISGVSLVSNWAAFVVASCLTLLGFYNEGLGFHKVMLALHEVRRGFPAVRSRFHEVRLGVRKSHPRSWKKRKRRR